METKIRELVVNYGTPFVEKFDDYSETSDKEILCEKVLNSIDWNVPISLISETLVDELVVFMTSFVEKGVYDLETIEDSFKNMVDLACFPEHNTNINREELLGRIDWENVFEQLV